MTVAFDLLPLFTQAPEEKPPFRLGTIPATYTTGRPSVIFDGEGTASARKYPYLSSYTPAPGDQVLIAMVGRRGAVIVGKVL